MRDGIAKYILPEKAMSRLMKFLSFDFFILWLMLKFLLVSLIKSANITVKILDKVAIPKLVKRDFKKILSLNIFIKSAPSPSIKIATRGKIKIVVKIKMIVV